MRKVSTPRRIVTLLAGAGLGILGAGCNKDHGNNGGGNDNQPNGGVQSPGGTFGGPGGGPMNGQSISSLAPIVDLSGAKGLLVMDSSKGASLELTGDAGAEAEGSLQKLDADGKPTSAVSFPAETKSAQAQIGGPKQTLPKIATIAVSPAHDIYLHFERPFVYKQPPAGVDPNDQSSGYQCQIFKVAGGTLADLQSTAPDAPNLECIDSAHFVDSWRTGRNSVFQFDDASNVYYPGSIPNGNGKMVVYKRTRDGSSVSEVINANICVQDFLVTKNGGVFYTGASQCGGSGGGGGFFRYVKPNGGGIVEIARDWWNFVFEPVEGSSGDSAVFFGPDPGSATTASWNSACLFNFNPDGATAADRIANVVTCGADIWGWINMSRPVDKTTFGRGYQDGENNPSGAWKSEFKTRCESQGQVFAGGGSQISSIKQDSAGNVFVIGNLRKKKAGVVSCNIQIKGAHCVVDGAPIAFNAALDTDAECTAAGGTWIKDNGYCEELIGGGSPHYQGVDKPTRESCLVNTGLDQNGVSRHWVYRQETYNNVASDLCNDADSPQRVTNLWDQNVRVAANKVGTADVSEDTPKFSADWMRCGIAGESSNGGGGDQWTDEFKAMAKVDAGTASLTMLSGSSEQAVNLWLIDDKPYYSSYDVGLGQYFLKTVNPTNAAVEVVASNFEVYNLAKGATPSTLFYDGLDFSNNNYSFGTVEKAAPYGRTEATGLTGTVKTIVILPAD